MNSDVLVKRARDAISYSQNFATAKPNIGTTEQEHILGLCELVADLADRIATQGSALESTPVQGVVELPEYAASFHVSHYLNSPGMRNTEFVEEQDFPKGTHRLYTAAQLIAYGQACASARPAKVEPYDDVTAFIESAVSEYGEWTEFGANEGWFLSCEELHEFARFLLSARTAPAEGEVVGWTPLPYETTAALFRAFKGGAKFILHYHGKEYPVTHMEAREHVVYVQPPSMPVKVYADGRSAEGPGTGIWLQQLTETPAPVVDLEQFRHVVQFYREKSGSWAHHGADPKDVAEADRLLAIIDTARPAKAEGDAWRQIESAPQDGRTLLLGYLNRAGKWRTVRGQWFSQETMDEVWEDPDACEPGWFETSEEAEDVPNCWPIEPTHWMALPKQPVDDTARTVSRGDDGVGGD